MDQEHPLRRYRRDKGITLEHLARQVGASAVSISRIENRRQQPTHGLLINLSEATGISIDDLVRAGAEAA